MRDLLQFIEDHEHGQTEEYMQATYGLALEAFRLAIRVADLHHTDKIRLAKIKKALEI